jgi:transcription elongation factor Elf1
MNEQRDNYHVGCKNCNDTGLVSGVHRKTGAVYTFRCGVCQASRIKGLSERIPLWTSQAKVDYESYAEYFKREGWKKS